MRKSIAILLAGGMLLAGSGRAGRSTASIEPSHETTPTATITVSPPFSDPFVGTPEFAEAIRIGLRDAKHCEMHGDWSTPESRTVLPSMVAGEPLPVRLAERGDAPKRLLDYPSRKPVNYCVPVLLGDTYVFEFWLECGQAVHAGGGGPRGAYLAYREGAAAIREALGQDCDIVYVDDSKYSCGGSVVIGWTEVEQAIWIAPSEYYGPYPDPYRDVERRVITGAQAEQLAADLWTPKESGTTEYDPDALSSF